MGCYKMTKKNFKTGFDSLLGEEKIKTKVSNNIQEIRATFIVKTDYLDKLKAISYWERKMIKDVINEALVNYINLYEKNKGSIPLPK